MPSGHSAHVGTNFPGVLKEVGYHRALEMFSRHMDLFGAGERDWLFHRTAESLWRFGE